jgi:phosphotriesterase-related protein
VVVETVTGPIGAGELGPTLVHEHLLVRDEAVAAQWPDAETWGGVPERRIAPGGQYEAALEAARAAVELGVRSICDPTAMFLGRDVEFMREVSKETGLQVVACTGIYSYDHLPSFFATRSADEIAAFYVQDIERGIQGTDIKAGFIKCAADQPGVTEPVEKLHRAAARASVRTGTPIMAHSDPKVGTGPRQVEIFLEEGVEPALVQIAHTGDTDDLGYIEGLLDRGVFIGMDRFGQEMLLPYEDRMRTLLALLERGYADRMFLGADSGGTLDWFPPALAQQMIDDGETKDADIRMVPRRVLPDLRERGVADEELETMMVTNPLAWLTGAGAGGGITRDAVAEATPGG